jgi:exopolysaccharide biosynthesis protein
VKWQDVRPGLAWGSLRLAGTGEAWRIRAIVVSVDPRRFRLRLDAAVGDDGRAGPWTVDDAPRDAALALNAGQFTSDGGPWGWVVHEGREIRPPGSGPLAPAIVVDSAGALRFVPPRDIATLRDTAHASSIVEAFQSYPTLLDGDGDVPAPLTDTGRGLDLAHRDSRLAIGETRDGSLLILITRFEGLGGTLESLPFGITVPETAALMGALGCRHAVMLDGGLSGQLLLRPSPSPSTPALAWRGLRRVALGLVAVARQ